MTIMVHFSAEVFVKLTLKPREHFATLVEDLN